MTKSLTEQWKEGTIKEGYYYIIIKDMDGIIIDSFDTWYHLKGNPIKQFSYVDIQEVLAHVPSYDEYNELTQKVENLEWDKKEDDALINFCNKRLVKYHKEIAKLKERLKEAEHILDEMGWADRGLIDDYFEKWGWK